MFDKIKQSYAEPFDSAQRYCTSWLLPPLALCSVRALFGLYCFVTLFFIYGWQDSHGGEKASQQSFSYFTYLTYWGLAFYFAFAATHTGTYAISGKPILKRFPRLLQTAHGVFYSTIVVYPFLVTIVYWGMINHAAHFSDRFQVWSNVSQHALNSVFAFTELALTRTAPLPFWHVVPLVIILALYLALAYITYSTEHFWVYSFLNNRNGLAGTAAGYIVAILVVTIVVFGAVHYAIEFRAWVTETKLGMHGRFASADALNRGGRTVELREPESVDVERQSVQPKPVEMQMLPPKS